MSGTAVGLAPDQKPLRHTVASSPHCLISAACKQGTYIKPVSKVGGGMDVQELLMTGC